MLDLALGRSSLVPASRSAIRELRRLRLPLRDLQSTDARLASVHEDWSARRGSSSLPAWSGTETNNLRPFVDRLQVVEALEPPRPTAGRFQPIANVVGSHVADDELFGFMDLSLDCPTGDPVVRGMIEDYTNVAFFGSPALHRVTAVGLEQARSFHRLVLPLAADGRRVSLLLVCVNVAAA